MTTETISLEKIDNVTLTELCVYEIEECSRVQVRTTTSHEAVERYREAFESGAVLPPMVVFQEPNTERYVVADGHHRLKGLKAAEIDNVDVEIKEGDETDALEYALSANSEHGLPRTKADIRNGVRLLMANAALTSKYRTHQDKSDLLRISTRTLQRYLAEWRESEGGSAAERRAKKQAQERAEKSTNRQNDDTCHRQNGDVSRDKLKPPRHTLKGQERQNLVDFEGSTERLATFPISGADAAEKYLAEVKDVNVDHVRRAHAWLGEFLEVAG